MPRKRGEGDGYEIELRSDSTYTTTIKDQILHGDWSRVDWNVYLTPNGGIEHYMRFVEDGGRAIITTKFSF